MHNQNYHRVEVRRKRRGSRFGVWRLKKGRLAFRPEGPWDPSPGFSLGNVFCEEPGLKDRQKRKLRDQPRRSQYWGGAEVARFLSVLQTSHAKTTLPRLKPGLGFQGPPPRRPGYGGQVGPKRRVPNVHDHP